MDKIPGIPDISGFDDGEFNRHMQDMELRSKRLLYKVSGVKRALERAIVLLDPQQRNMLTDERVSRMLAAIIAANPDDTETDEGRQRLAMLETINTALMATWRIANGAAEAIERSLGKGDKGSDDTIII